MAQSPLRNSVRSFIDERQSRGRYSFVLDEIGAETGRSAIAIAASLRRLKAQRRVVSPRRGFFVIVPPEYRSAGSPPASWFIDDLMRFLGQPYYVGVLSAAAIYGAAHQQPQVFQVITDRPTRPARAGRVHVVFHAGRPIERRHTELKQTETGTMLVATPETTAFDLVHYQAAAGHLGNVATVLRELAERLDGSALVTLAAVYAVPDVQRLGYLLEQSGQPGLADPLAAWLVTRRVRPVALAPGESRGDLPSENRWRVIPNEAVEADL
jgi:predicted transcriptional regulator of viral defense system